MAFGRLERHRTAPTAGYKGSTPPPPHPWEDRLASRAQRRRSLRRAPPRGAPLPGPQGGAAQRGERERGARASCLARPPAQRLGSRAAAPHAARPRRRRRAFVCRREPRSDVDQGEEAEGPQPPGKPEAGPAHPCPGLGLPPLLVPAPPCAFPGTCAGDGAPWAALTPRLWRSSRTPSSRGLGPHLGGGWAPSVADQAANGRPRARPLLALPGAALAPSGAGPGVCAQRPELRGGRSPARPLPRPSRRRASRPRPCTPLIGGGGGGGASAEPGSGRPRSGGWAVGTSAGAGKPRGSHPCARTSTFLLFTSLGRPPGVVEKRGWREAEAGDLRAGRGCDSVCEKIGALCPIDSSGSGLESGKARFWDVCSHIRCLHRSLGPSVLGILKVRHFKGNVGRILAQASVYTRSLVVRGAVQGGAEEGGIGFHVCSSGCIDITVLGLSELLSNHNICKACFTNTSEPARCSE